MQKKNKLSVHRPSKRLINDITDDELDGVWELMQEIWGNGSFLSMMAEMLEDNGPKGGYNAN